MIQLSERAVGKVKELLTSDNKTGYGLRVAIHGGGCSGFKIENPNASGTCGCGHSFQA